jgi:hypothetical protein
VNPLLLLLFAVGSCCAAAVVQPNEDVLCSRARHHCGPSVSARQLLQLATTIKQI